MKEGIICAHLFKYLQFRTDMAKPESSIACFTDQTPTEAAKREIWEESGYVAKNVVSLKSVCHIPTDIFPYKYLYNWPSDTYVVPEYSFGFLCVGDMVLSHEHTECVWLTYAEAKEKLKWDSNRTALYELNCILTNKRNYSNEK